MSELPSYCVFRKETIWFALPAKVIREVMPCPKLVSIPRSRQVLSGLSHLRSEFIPVLNFSSLLPDLSYGDEEFLMIIEESNGDWGLLVNEVDSLSVLEPSNAPDEGREGWESTVNGWATYQDHVVRILDNIRFRELAAQELNPAYQSQNHEVISRGSTY